MATKATHNGTCQVCDHVQKLPGNRLSKHGYTTRWGFFSGTCTGSGHQPFEQSKDLVEDAIARAQARAIELREQAVKVVEQADPKQAWLHEYVPAQRVGRSTIPSTYRWVTIELSKNDNGYVVYQDAKGRTERLSGYFTSIDTAAVEQAKSKADWLKNLAKQADQYVVWQRERIANWAPKALQAVADEAPKKQTTRTQGARVSVYIGRDKDNNVIRREGVVVSTSRDYFLNAAVKFDDGTYTTVRVSYLALVTGKEVK